MALRAAWASNAGQLRQPAIDLKVEGPACKQDAHGQDARFPEYLGDPFQPSRIPARPGAERVHLIQHQQRRPTRRHPGQHSGRRSWQAHSVAKAPRIPEFTEPIQPHGQYDKPFRGPVIARGPPVQRVENLSKQRGLAQAGVTDHRHHGRPTRVGHQFRKIIRS